MYTSRPSAVTKNVFGKKKKVIYYPDKDINKSHETRRRRRSRSRGEEERTWGSWRTPYGGSCTMYALVVPNFRFIPLFGKIVSLKSKIQTHNSTWTHCRILDKFFRCFRQSYSFKTKWIVGLVGNATRRVRYKAAHPGLQKVNTK